MPIEEKVKLSADTSGLKEIEQANRKAFNPASMREYKRAGKELERDHTMLNRRLVELTRTMRGLDKGTEAFKDMRKELRGIQQDAKLVATAMEAVQRATQPRPGRGAFVAGLGQGAGLAQYIPTGPGMGARMVGAGVGGMARRGVGAAARPFLTPGMGGMVGMLSALPGGGLAGGALQAASAYYQEAVQFQRQRLENLPFVANLGGRLRRSRQMAGAAAAAAPAALSETERMQILREEAGEAVARIQIASRTRRQQPGISPMGRGIRMPSLEVKKEDIIESEARRAERESERRIKETNQARAVNAERQIRRAAARGFGAISGPAEAMAPGLGFMAGEAQQMIGGFMGARGGVRDRATEAQLREALIVRRRFGIGAEVSGGFQRMFQPGGGGAVAGQQTLSRVIGSAMAQGLKGVRINEYLQSLVEIGRRAEQTGVKINVQELTQGAIGMAAMGIAPGQAGRVAGGVQQAAMRVSAQGVQSPMDLLVMRAAGWDPTQGREGYFAASNKLAGGMTAEMMQRLVGMVTTGAAGGGPEERVTMVRRAMGKMGVQVGPEQARKFIRSFEGGELTEATRAEFQRLTGRGEELGQVGKFYQEARGGGRRLGGAAITEAGLERARIGAGAEFAGLMASMQKATIASVGALGNFSGALKALSDSVTKFMQAIDKMLQGNFIETAITGGK